MASPPNLPFRHFLAQPRLLPTAGNSIGSRQSQPTGLVDTTTLAAHDFDIDVRTGFMPPLPPVSRLPAPYDPWEDCLASALVAGFRLGNDTKQADAERIESAAWRDDVRQLPMLPTDRLARSELYLRRAHHVLTYILHIFIHTHPPAPASSSYLIPPPLSIPLISVSNILVLPPVLTYSDTVLYNWRPGHNTEDNATSLPPLECLTLFSQTPSEAHFYLTSAWIELAGTSALAFMRAAMNEAFVADSIALSRIASYLTRLTPVVARLTKIIDDVRTACDPHIFYHAIRPWFNGEDPSRRRWVFLDEDGVSEIPSTMGAKRELGGPSAGQSSLIHALDVFLSVDHSDNRPGADPTFLDRMQGYMPRHHRAFLKHLRSGGGGGKSIRELVLLAERRAEASESMSERKVALALREAYNAAVLALKEFRDAHIRIVTLYIVSQAPRKRPPPSEAAPVIQNISNAPALSLTDSPPRDQQKGTGGTTLIPFLKATRDDTKRSVLDRE